MLYSQQKYDICQILQPNITFADWNQTKLFLGSVQGQRALLPPTLYNTLGISYIIYYKSILYH